VLSFFGGARDASAPKGVLSKVIGRDSRACSNLDTTTPATKLTMVSFSTLPTELRQMILGEFDTSTLEVPSTPNHVGTDCWLLGHTSHQEVDHRRIPGAPTASIRWNTELLRRPPHLPLMLVNIAFKADMEVVLSRVQDQFVPFIDVMVKGDLFTTWLSLQRPRSYRGKSLNIRVPLFEVYQTENHDRLEGKIFPCQPCQISQL